MKKILTPKELQALNKPYVEVKGEPIVRLTAQGYVVMVENRIIFT